jgi:hypothetical protein
MRIEPARLLWLALCLDHACTSDKASVEQGSCTAVAFVPRCRRANQQAPTAPSRIPWLPKTLRAKANSTSHFNAIWVVQIGTQKYSA